MEKKKILFVCFAISLSFIFSLGAAELILRIFPIPGIKIACTKFDELIGGTLYPSSTVIYSNRRGDFLRRKVNSWGYLDTEHKKEKGKFTYRIGFFGDSNVEAQQVALQDTFFRIIEKKLEKYNVECLAFALSGRGTLHSYLESARMTDPLDIDLVVYVFCENDIGDNIKEIKRSSYLPYAVLKKDAFEIDYSFREKYSFKNRFYYKLYLYLKNRSLVLGTIATRIKLLAKYGIKIEISEAERMMATKSKPGEIPQSTDLPSSWPDSWREHAKKLASVIILKWRDEITVQSREFTILYIPRESEMEKAIENQDSWKFWLESFCNKNNIVFIDPTENLIKVKLLNKDVFYDHFTKDGHKALAEAFVNWFIKNPQMSK